MDKLIVNGEGGKGEIKRNQRINATDERRKKYAAPGKSSMGPEETLTSPIPGTKVISKGGATMPSISDSTKEVSGTIYGSYDYKFEGKGAWVGDAILAFDGKSPVKASFVDRNSSISRTSDGGIAGAETITLSFSDGARFEIRAKFTGTPASSPGLYTLHETGWIASGTGAYERVSGHVVIEGPFLFPDPTITPGAPPWIATIHGVVNGLDT